MDKFRNRNKREQNTVYGQSQQGWTGTGAGDEYMHLKKMPGMEDEYMRSKRNA